MPLPRRIRRYSGWQNSDPRRPRRLGRAGALTIAVLLALSGPATAEGRVALVIGNSAYKHVPGLDNPGNDATDMAAALGELGFEVFAGRDLTHDLMLARIDEFARAAANADVALFYFAGHAFQVGGRNFLIPTDLAPTDPQRILTQSVLLDTVMEALETAPGLRLLFLDACRDNPLALSQAAGGEGLARVGAGANFLIAYATQPGAVAFDGDGRNGTFTKALLSHIHTPGLNVADMMISVRKDVIAATGGQQIPWENTSLTQTFRFDDGPREASPETMFYQVAARSNNADLLSLYLERYPQGAHVAEASSHLIAARSGIGGLSDGRSLGDGADETAQDVWLLAKRTRMRPVVEFYLATYPTGADAEEARRLLAALPAESELGPGQLCERLATHPNDASAATSGVPFARLAEHADLAIAKCRAAVRAFPEQPRFVALLARALITAGQVDEAVAFYQEAAARGDLRALVSLGILYENGNGVPRDPYRALELYERAAEGGSPDGAINLAAALFAGQLVDKDVPRAIELFRTASEAGSPVATFNLGVLAQGGLVGDDADAFELFQRAGQEGEPRGYRAAAVLLDEGRGINRNPSRAARLLLRGAAEDRGEVLDGIAGQSDRWSPDTIRGMQGLLKKPGFYPGALDGVVGPQFVEALRKWRNGGFDAGLLEG